MKTRPPKPERQMQMPNLEYSEELYQSYLEDPQSVENSWRWFFQGMNAVTSSDISKEDFQKEVAVFQLLQAYRDHGNLKAQLDPLNLEATVEPDDWRTRSQNFPTLEKFNLTETDMNKKFFASQYFFGFSKKFKRNY